MNFRLYLFIGSLIVCLSLLPTVGGAADLIDLEAESLRYEFNPPVVEAVGQVNLRYGEMKLEGDYLRVNLQTYEVLAQGRVLMKRNGQILRGERIKFNLEKGRGKIDLVKGSMDNFYFSADEGEVSQEEINLTKGKFTTCNLSPPHYHIQAEKVQIFPGDRVVIVNATLYLGSQAIFWYPRLVRYFHRRNELILPRSGYNDFAGWYFLSGYSFETSRDWQGRVHLDYWEKKGWGLGLFSTWGQVSTLGKTLEDEDIEITEDSANGRSSQGEMEIYYIPERDSGEQRGGFRLKHQYPFNPSTCFKLCLDYWSDDQILEDYFPEKPAAEKEILPSFVSLDLWRSRYNFRFIVEPRVNYFLPEVRQRLPGIKFNFFPSQLGESGVYLKETSELGHFIIDDESILRADSLLELSYPFTLPASLRIVPSGGLHLFHYQEQNGKGDDFAILYQKYSLYTGFEGKWGKFTDRFAPTLTYYHSFPFPEGIPHLDYKEDAHPESFLKINLNSDFFYDNNKFINAEINWNYDFTANEEKSSPLEGKLNLFFSSTGEDYLSFHFLYQPDERTFPVTGADFSLKGEDWFWDIGFREYRDYQVKRLFTQVGTTLGKKWLISSKLNWNLISGTLEEEEYSLWRDLHCWAAEVSLKLKPRQEYRLTLYLTAFPRF